MLFLHQMFNNMESHVDVDLSMMFNNMESHVAVDPPSDV